MAKSIMPENLSYASAINAALANMTAPTAISMTSKEIAEMVGSRHDKTKQSIERLVNQGIIALPPMGDVPFVDDSGRNRTTTAYIFSGEQGKRDSIVVVAQLSPEFTARLVDRWQELESKVTQPASGMKDPKLVTMVETLIRLDYLQQEQEALAKRQDEVESQLDETKDRVNALMGGDTWVTVKGYAAKNGYPGDRASLSQIGKMAAKACRATGTTPVDVPDEIWDTVKSYPREIVSEAFEEYYGKSRLNS
jgi:phage regulator Rha-like protein